MKTYHSKLITGNVPFALNCMADIARDDGTAELVTLQFLAHGTILVWSTDEPDEMDLTDKEWRTVATFLSNVCDGHQVRVDLTSPATEPLRSAAKKLKARLLE